MCVYIYILLPLVINIMIISGNMYCHLVSRFHFVLWPFCYLKIYNVTYTKSFSLSAVSLGWVFCTGFLEYKMTAKLTIAIEMTVFVLIGILNKIQQSVAVKINSIALAKVFNIEFKVFKKKLVIIPTSALFNIINITFGCKNALISTLLNVSFTLFFNVLNKTIATMLQKMLSIYINTFCTKMSMSAPCRFSKYSLYTPAKQEHIV